MKPLNITALVLFIIAKLLGLTGVAIGFVHRIYGGTCLTGAIVLLFCSIVFSAIQLSHDRKEIELEDGPLRQLQALQRKRQELEWQIEDLENLKIKMSGS